jgi:hypothetical protein
VVELQNKHKDILDLIDEQIYIGEGWCGIVDECLTKLQKLKTDNPEKYGLFKVKQIKIKFGSLRVYVDADPDVAIDKIIWDAVEKSAITCLLCGKPGKSKDYRVLCLDCKLSEAPQWLS